MPSLKSLKNRIKSIRSTQKITKAMKMVAASKLKRARERAENSAQYADHMVNLVNTIARSIDSTAAEQLALLHGTGKEEVNLIIVFTSDRGLCGAFNQNVIKLTRRAIQEFEQNNQKVKIICIG